MRRLTVLLVIAALSLLLGVPAANAQTATTLPGIPAGQGGPDNNVNATQQGGDAQGGRDNPAADAGPAVSTEDGGSLTPWLVGAAVLVFLAAAGAIMARALAGGRREPSYSG